MKRLMDIYSDYLICQNGLSTATGLAAMLPGDVSHDQVTRLLNGPAQGSKELWAYAKPLVRRCEMDTGGVLILDDTIEEKPYTDENDIVCWHYSHMKGMNVKGINILSCLVNYGDVYLPVCYDVTRKDVSFCDLKTRKIKRKSKVGKNEIFRNLIKASLRNGAKFDYVAADIWFSSKENMNFIHHKAKKRFVMGIKSNRLVARSEADKKAGKFRRADSLDMEDGGSEIVWLEGISFPVALVKKVFTNEDGSTGILYLMSDDIKRDGEAIYGVYQKRWGIEVYHKSIKQNASLAKSPTKCERSQSNHIFASIIAFCKLEALKVKTCINHFALKMKLVLTANQASFLELRNINRFAAA